MPPEICHSHSHPFAVTPKTPLLSRLSQKSRFKQILHQKRGRKMKFPKKKLIPLLVFILCGASIFRFLNISRIRNYSAPHFLPIHQQDPSKGSSISANSSTLTEKEMQFLLKFLSHKVPCNLLIFGLGSHYSSIASLNAGGFTVFLEDHLQSKSTTNSINTTQVHNIIHNTLASEAYQLLKDARENPHCGPHLTRAWKCNLALSNLPQLVYNTMWDVVVVDGPDGSTPDSPGRMASIYMAGILARRGNATHVIVHDVHRMIEKWFSWEYLCEENLVSSKGRFWHFQIVGVASATTKFCRE